MDRAAVISERRTPIAIAIALCLLAIAGCDTTPAARAPGVPAPTAAEAPAPATDPPPPISPNQEFTPAELRRIERFSPLGPPPPDPTNRVADDPRAQALGRELFDDVRLSGPKTIACSTCHDPRRDFTDGTALPETLAVGTRNTPALWNVAWGKSFFWDGRSTTLWGQAIVPIEHPGEMGGDRLEVAHRIASDAALRARFEHLFGPWPSLDRYPARRMVAPPEHPSNGPRDLVDFSPFTAEYLALSEEDRRRIDSLAAQVGKVLAAFQRTLVSGETPFDRAAPRILRGEPTPDYPAAARRGLKLFVGKARCHLCHSGPDFSDQAFHRTGIVPRPGLPEDRGRIAAGDFLRRDPFGARSAHSDAPEGEAASRAARLQFSPDDFAAFRTPGLRNVARTAPYMHAGQLPTLEAVIRFYSDRVGALLEDPAHPEPLNEPLFLSEAEIADLVAFLETLSDERATTLPRNPSRDRK